LVLVAENDFGHVKRAAGYALANGTGVKRPKFGEMYGEFEKKTARMVKIVPETNHLSIVFDEASHESVLSWLNRIGGKPNEGMRIGGSAKPLLLLIGVLFGASVAVVGIGLLFSPVVQSPAGAGEGGVPAWAMIMLFAAAWPLAAFLGNALPMARKIPLLVYGRVLVYFAFASVPFFLLAAIKPKLGAGPPRGSWRARAILVAATLTLLLLDHWLLDVTPSGIRLLWFLVAAMVTGGYFLGDEFFRRKVQSVTDWQTGFALGLAGSFIVALSLAGASFFVGPPVGQFLVVGSATVFLLLALCEIPATYLFAATGDWLLSWWVRASIFNGLLAGLVPLISETDFRIIAS